MYQLVNGDLTYDGGKMQINHIRDNVEVFEGRSGWPIDWQLVNKNYPYLYALDHANAMKNANVSTTETPFHEISHNFDNYKWEFEPEALAILKIYYHYSVSGQTMICAGINPSFSGKTYKTYMKSYANRINGHVSYDKAMSQGKYSPYILAYRLGDIADKIGWDVFTDTFTYFYNLPYDDVPASELGILNLFLSKLKDFSGEDVFSMFTEDELDICREKFGGEIEYYDARTTLVLIPGTMGSRLYYNGDRKWEPEWLEAVIDFETKMKPYLLNNEDGKPIYTLDPTRESETDYGALETYEDIYKYLLDEDNFPSEDYKVKFFTYDWRLSNSVSAEKLEDFISSDDKVVLIAHSMGGLVASAYIARSYDNLEKVKKLITFGTPYLGATKTVVGLETGNFLGALANAALAPHLKDISKNVISVYEMLPTSKLVSIKVPDSTGLNKTLNYSEGREFLKTREWGLKGNGSPKRMFASGESFNTSLYDIAYADSDDYHAAEYVDATYIIGTGHDTPSIAVYEEDGDGFKYDTFENVSGDGTVVERSAKNGYGDYYAFSKKDYGNLAEHSGLVKNADALDLMKDLINGVSVTPLMTRIMDTPSNDSDDEGNDITMVLQGAKSLSIYDSSGNEILNDGQKLYKLDADGSSVDVGTIWLIDAERLRYQYIFDPDEYIVTDLEFDESITPEMLYMTFKNYNTYLSYAEYTGFVPSNTLQVNMSYDSCTIQDVASEEYILPTTEADNEELKRMNEGR